MPSKAVFLDTNGWIALLNSADLLHSLAKSTWVDLGKRGCEVIFTDWIVAETGNGLARTQARERFSEAVNLIRSSSRTRLLPVSQKLGHQEVHKTIKNQPGAQPRPERTHAVCPYRFGLIS